MSKRKNRARRHAQGAENQDDVFVANVLEASRWAESNRQLVILGTVAITLLAAGTLYYVNFQSSMREQAVNRLENIQQTVSIQAKEDAKQQLGTFLDRFAGTPEAEEGLILLARLHLEAGDAGVAINALENGAPSFKTGIGIQTNFLLARAYEQEGRWADAERQYIRIADAPAALDFQVIESLENAARARVRQQDAAGAVELYDRILATLDDSDPSRGMYEMRRAEMREIAS
jgi:predicted negative regulator of RcsB-dependent stress response